MTTIEASNTILVVTEAIPGPKGDTGATGGTIAVTVSEEAPSGAGSLGDLWFVPDGASSINPTASSVPATPQVNYATGSSVQTQLQQLDTALSTVAGNKRFGGANDYSEFEADGTLKMTGEATVWNDLITSASNLRPGSSSPDFSAFRGGIYAFSFANAVTDELHGSFELQHDYKEGTDLLFHIHWSPSTTNVGNVLWGVEYVLAPRSGVYATTPTTVQTALAAGGVAFAHNVENIATIPGAGVTIGTQIIYRVFRAGADALDTFTGAAFLHSIGIHYECDTLGSRGITTK